MPFTVKKLQTNHLTPLTVCNTQDVIALCKIAFDYLFNGPEQQQEIYKAVTEKYDKQFETQDIQQAVEALISLLIEATKAKVDEKEVMQPLILAGFKEDTVQILTQFVTSKRNFVEGSIKTANIRAYRLVNMEWRLEVRLASRTAKKQTQVFVTMKMYLHTEPKNENRDLLEENCKIGNGDQQIHEDEKRNRKDLLVQTDLSTLTHIIQSLEEALIESRTRRIRNIVAAIH